MEQAQLDKAAEWLENNGYTVYADYRDELPEEAVKALLSGDEDAFGDEIADIEMNFYPYIDWESHRDDLIEAMGWDIEDVADDEDFKQVFEDHRWLDMSDWIDTAARNTSVHVTATPYTGEPLKAGERIFEEDQDERLFLFPHGYCSDEENERRRQKLLDVLGYTCDGEENMYEFDELKVLGTLDLADIIKNGMPTHITIGPDTPNEMLGHNTVNGSGGMGSIKPTKTVTLPAMFEIDEPRYGVQAVYGFVGEVWAKPLPASRPE